MGEDEDRMNRFEKLKLMASNKNNKNVNDLIIFTGKVDYVFNYRNQETLPYNSSGIARGNVYKIPNNDEKFLMIRDSRTGKKVYSTLQQTSIDVNGLRPNYQGVDILLINLEEPELTDIKMAVTFGNNTNKGNLIRIPDEVLRYEVLEFASS